MEDLELQLLNLLKDNWEVDKDKILFHRNLRRIEGSLQQTNIIVAEQTDVNKADKEAMLECLALATVRTRVPAQGTTNELVEEAKTLKHTYREEIYRILRLCGADLTPYDFIIADDDMVTNNFWEKYVDVIGSVGQCLLADDSGEGYVKFGKNSLKFEIPAGI